MARIIKERVYSFTVYAHVETDRAVLASTNNKKVNAVWYPKSQVDFHDNGDGTYEMVLPEWLAIEKGLV